MKTLDTVSVLVPLKAEYVSIARLTASGIANKIGFDFETIEDIKVALSEVLSKIIEKKPSDERVAIDFLCADEALSMRFSLSDPNVLALFDSEIDTFALAIINSLMDEVDLIRKGHSLMAMTKKLGKAV